MMKPASQSGLEGRREPDLPSRGQGSFHAAPASTAAALNVDLTVLSLSCSSVPTPMALFSPGSLPFSHFWLCCQSGSSNTPRPKTCRNYGKKRHREGQSLW